jgi:alpha-D-xyloside xylohydrolase
MVNPQQETPRNSLLARTAILLSALAFSGHCLPASAANTTRIPVVSVHKDADGITLKMNPGVLKLQVFSPDVIRVLYMQGDSLPPDKSLAVIGKPGRARWKVSETAEEVRLRTGEIEVRVNRASGAVRFFDKSGIPVLAEPPDGGKLLAPNRVGSLNTLRSQQAFLLPSDEAIYGLGQHQEGLMNYRESNVRLLQENREVAVPMLVSSRGYGVLWDNPAVTVVSVGGGKDETVPATQLFTDDGQPGGLTASYFRGGNFDEPVATRRDPQVEFNWSEVPPPDLPHDQYSVRWSGFIEAEQAGNYLLLATADDGVRVWLDDQLLVNDWSDHAAETLVTKVNFDAHSRHHIRMEYYQNGGGAVVRLAWQLPSEASLPLTWTSEAADSIDYYFLYGPAIDKVIAAYRRLTGPAPMFGKWAWGFWQCKNRYQTQQELLDVVSRYRSLHVPIDGIIQDWQYWTPHPWGSHQFDEARYPDPARLMSDLHAENAHLLISVWAKFDLDSPNANELRSAGALYQQVIPYVYPPGKGQWYDAFNPTARQVYWRQLSKELFAFGIDGWWLDASEPELSGNWGEFRNYTTAAGPGAKVFNAYPLMHTSGVYAGQRAQNPEKRVFILTRSAYAGQQRNAAVTWSGDIQGTWDVFAKQIPAGLNFSLSGIPYWNTDTGGFFGGDPANPAYAELFTRWFQFSAFCPMLRVHGDGPPKEMWRFDSATQKTLADYDQLRYHLLPYIYSLSWRVTTAGYSLMRGLVMDFREDPKVHNISDQYMFGPALMAAPVTKPGAVSRKVYLPAGTIWTDFWTGKTYAGNQEIEAPSPIATMPLFVRAGSIIPYGPSVEYAMEKTDPIELRVYRGADGGFTLYEDEGDNYNYEKGAYATIPIAWNESTHTLKIGKRKGNFAGMPAEHTFRIVWVSPDHGTGIQSTDQADLVIRYRGEALAIPAGE